MSKRKTHIYYVSRVNFYNYDKIQIILYVRKLNIILSYYIYVRAILFIIFIIFLLNSEETFLVYRAV